MNFEIEAEDARGNLLAIVRVFHALRMSSGKVDRKRNTMLAGSETQPPEYREKSYNTWIINS